MRKFHTVMLVLGLWFLGYLVWLAGPAQIWAELRSLGWGVLGLVLSEGVANVAHVIGWRYCLPGRGNRVGFWRLFRIGMAGYSINYLTPSASVGGEVTKAALLTSDYASSEAAGSVMMDKLTTAGGHLALVVLGSALVIWRVRLPGPMLGAMVAGSAVVACGLGAFLWVQQRGKIGAVVRWLAGSRLGGRTLRKAAENVSAVDESLRRFYREQRRDLAMSLGWHVVGHAVNIFQVWMFLWLLHQPGTFLVVLTASLLGLWFDLVSFAVPLNLGALEGGRLLALRTVGCAVPVGMAFGLAVRIAQLSWAAFGLANYLAFSFKRVGGAANRRGRDGEAVWSLRRLRRRGA